MVSANLGELAKIETDIPLICAPKHFHIGSFSAS
jgi:hypothetical protein